MEHSYTLPAISYSYDALEPYIDARTMEIHHLKHHQGYVDKLNAAIERHPELKERRIEDILSDLASIPEDIRTAVRNNGGGHLSHSMYWTMMTPRDEEKKMSETLSAALSEHFGDVSRFKEAFSENAKTLFGSGWTWLTVRDGKLEICSTSGHDTPYVAGTTPIFVIDVWEHAYYLNYQNRRPDYIDAWWNVVNWKEVERRYCAAIL